MSSGLCFQPRELIKSGMGTNYASRDTRQNMPQRALSSCEQSERKDLQKQNGRDYIYEYTTLRASAGTKVLLEIHPLIPCNPLQALETSALGKT